ncbi:PAS domain S-box protein [Agaribacter flavus]|uniref:histidine kinase n=1 Tax=Agaribacter flavus TaxID=1902781 RepID=A0ABV7FN25_9ALTE
MSDKAEIQALPLDIIMNTVLDGLITIDSQGQIHSFNNAAQRIFQYSEDEVVGKNVKMLMPDPYHSEHDQYLHNYLSTKEKKIIGIGREVKAKRKDGSIFPIELGVNQMDVNGQVMFIGTIKDISDRKRAEQEIQNEKKQLLAIFNTVLDGLITIDQYGHIQSFNPAAEKIFGYAAQEVMGQNVRILMPNPFHDEHDTYLENYRRTGDKKIIGIGREVEAKRKDGSVFPIELGVAAMDNEGLPLFVGTIRDITQRVESEKAINSYIEALTRSNQELDDFAYIASHDLKEPLRGLSNNALFLQEDYEELLGEDGKRRVNRMKYLCGRLERLVDDLLYFSRLGRQDLAIQECDVNTIIHDITTMMENSLSLDNAKILIPSKLPRVVCDVPRITEVFRNLITNALKYNDKAEKLIEIGCINPQAASNEEEPLTFYVKDNGIGIDEVFFDDVFRIFKRLNDEDDSVKGTGVGLTFVKKIIQRHGGKIWIESQKHHGATFFFTLKHNG